MSIFENRSKQNKVLKIAFYLERLYMQKLLNYKIRKDVQKYWTVNLKTVLAVLPLPYFFYTFSHIVSCRQIMGCTWTDFASTFPFYLLLMTFVSKLNFLNYLLLFLVTTAIYIVIFYELGGWLEKQYRHFKEKPRFVFKRIEPNYSLVGTRGLEPPRDFSHTLLRRVRMPVPPRAPNV